VSVPFAQQAAARPDARQTATPAAALHYEQFPEPRDQAPQPLRTLSLEFTPDGSNDIRLRLSEHSGDVHVSLHSSDPSLSGRLQEGIHDLVGLLSTAGYDAEAWTPGQGRQNQQQPDDARKPRRSGKSDAGADRFGGLLHPTQEVL
jgi:hypothetical protein